MNGEETRAVDDVMLAKEIREAGRLLGAAGFTELPGVAKKGHRIGFRMVDEYYELVILFPDGHMEGIRQIASGPLWVPGQNGETSDDYEWVKSGGALEVVNELLSLPR